MSDLPSEILSDLERIRNLPDGWDDENASKVSEKILDEIKRLLSDLYPNDTLPIPSLGPTREGGIDISWDGNRVSLILEPTDEMARVMWALQPIARYPSDIGYEKFLFPQEIESCRTHIIKLLIG